MSPEQIARLLNGVRQNEETGVYIAFPFLTGTRPSEQLALHWEDVDLDARTIFIRRMQEADGTLVDLTKTPAGTRKIPIAPDLHAMLVNWRQNCPRANGELVRVFPTLTEITGVTQRVRKPEGEPLLYNNFLRKYWRPVFGPLGLPYVTPHSARHSFISVLQAEGVEVGLVAKLAGHANPAVTLATYTHAVRGGEAAIAALSNAYRISK